MNLSYKSLLVILNEYSQIFTSKRSFVAKLRCNLSKPKI